MRPRSASNLRRIEATVTAGSGRRSVVPDLAAAYGARTDHSGERPTVYTDPAMHGGRARTPGSLNVLPFSSVPNSGIFYKCLLSGNTITDLLYLLRI